MVHRHDCGRHCQQKYICCCSQTFGWALTPSIQTQSTFLNILADPVSDVGTSRPWRCSKSGPTGMLFAETKWRLDGYLKQATSDARVRSACHPTLYPRSEQHKPGRCPLTPSSPLIRTCLSVASTSLVFAGSVDHRRKKNLCSSRSWLNAARAGIAPSTRLVHPVRTHGPHPRSRASPQSRAACD